MSIDEKSCSDFIKWANFMKKYVKKEIERIKTWKASNFVMRNESIVLCHQIIIVKMTQEGHGEASLESNSNVCST